MELKLSKWPFYLGDALFLGAAWFIYSQSKLPMGVWQIFFVVLCVAGGAWLAIMPFLLEYRLAMKLAETDALTSAVSQIQNLESVAAQIGAATSQWHGLQEEAGKTAALSVEMAGRMKDEAQAFGEFMQRANDSEKATLRLEVEKLRRAESDWLQVLVRMLDHVYALRQGALRSNQPRLIEQLDHFQNACRDAARRVGLVPYSAAEAEPFDAQRHQLMEVEAKPPAGAVVGETLATGYTFQGKLLRQALVRIRNGSAGAVASPGLSKEEPEQQSQLSLDRGEA
jgi:molecular chaperone GrpE (heat shock protein)